MAKYQTTKLKPMNIMSADVVRIFKTADPETDDPGGH
jgi:hypothetical protein